MCFELHRIQNNLISVMLDANMAYVEAGGISQYSIILA